MRTGLTRAVLAAAAFLMMGIAAAATRHEPKRPSAAIRAGEAWAFWGFVRARPDPAFPHPSPHALLHVPGSMSTYRPSQLDSSFLTLDWFPSEHPPMPRVVAHGRRPAVAACGLCHGADGAGDSVSPPLAGLPETYILQQLRAFRSGARSTPGSSDPTGMLMPTEVKHLSASDMLAAAAYFSKLTFHPQTRVIEAQTVPRTGIGYFSLMAITNGGREPLGERIVEVTPPQLCL